jgi:hypothetical protein
MLSPADPNDHAFAKTDNASFGRQKDNNNRKFFDDPKT